MTQLNAEIEMMKPRTSGFTLSELEEQLDKIQDQIRHWEGVHDETTSSVRAQEKRQTAALEAIKVARSRLAAGGCIESGTMERAQRIFDSAAGILERDRKRTENAAVQIQSWTKRLEQFPHDEFKQLRTEQRKLDRLYF